MVTAAELIEATRLETGAEVVDSIPEAVFEAVVMFAHAYDLTISDGRVWDVLNLMTDEDKYYQGKWHVDGHGYYNYCNAAEDHVRQNPTHKVIVEYVNNPNDNGVSIDGFLPVLEVRCVTHEPNSNEPTIPHYWDHIA
jgi:hypothetical protein